MDLVHPGGADQLFEATADLEVGLLVHNAGANTCSQQAVAQKIGGFFVTVTGTTAKPIVSAWTSVTRRSGKADCLLFVSCQVGVLKTIIRRFRKYRGLR